MLFFDEVNQLPEDPIFGLSAAFARDQRKEKINLGIGSYKTHEGQPLVLNCVRKAERLLLHQQLNKEYLPIEGDASFLSLALSLLMGTNSFLARKHHFFSAQTVGGAGALRVGAEFLTKLVSKKVYVPLPSWSNHKQIFERAGFSVSCYPYFDEQRYVLDFERMCATIEKMEKKSVLLLHGCCHNPTGIDPSFEQWQALAALIKRKELIPFFDVAYQGLGEGIQQDVAGLRHFLAEGHEMLIAASFSKNFGLYGERVGVLAVVSHGEEEVPKIGSHIKNLIRASYSNPPLQGERIVSLILSVRALKEEWQRELGEMRQRVELMRRSLLSWLQPSFKNPYFENFYQQKGLFLFLGLTPSQVNSLREQEAIYIPQNGRINVAGLNAQNLPIVAQGLMRILR